MKQLLLFAICILTTITQSKSSSSAEIKMSRLFTDHMILQQNQKNAIWGWADPGEQVVVKASWGATETANADAKGQWRIFLDTPKYGTGFSLSVTTETDQVKIKDVAIGEVWLCAGQSNMGWTVGGTFEAEEEQTVDLPNLRIFNTASESSYEPIYIAKDRLAKWSKCTPSAANKTSAVSYYFGKKLHQELGIPVGIITKSFAGTPIEGWMPREIQLDDPRTTALIENKILQDDLWIKRAKSDRESLLKKFEMELAEYNRKIDAGETTRPGRKGEMDLKPPKMKGLATHFFQFPGNMYNAMIHPIRGYGIKGMIWYQGERNSKTAQQAFNYKKQLSLLIKHYRETWHAHSGGNVAEDFYFSFTQLPSFNSVQKAPVEGVEAPWAVNREAMRLVNREVENTGMAVSIDTGDIHLLHPRNKKPIGIRHAYNALKEVYGKDFIAHGPYYKDHKIDGKNIILSFDGVGSGLKSAKSESLNSFAIAGSDQQWVWAEANISADKIILSSALVQNPVAVRYAWAMNPSQRNLLYNEEGLPASPFRTDDWPLFANGADEIRSTGAGKPDAYKPVDWPRPVMKQ